MAKKLGVEFYSRKDVVKIAKELLGKILITNWKGMITSGRIVECEAYAGIIDKASHASGGRRTPRNEIMYGEGGYAYVYLCYGIHHLFNVVTNSQDIPHAILIRALDPIEGIEDMLYVPTKKNWIIHSPVAQAMYQRHWEYLQSIQDFHCWATRSILLMTVEYIARRKLQLRHALGSIMQATMPYYHIVFM